MDLTDAWHGWFGELGGSFRVVFTVCPKEGWGAPPAEEARAYRLGPSLGPVRRLGLQVRGTPSMGCTTTVTLSAPGERAAEGAGEGSSE